MKLPLQITARNVDRSEALEAHIREKAAKLERFSRHITRFHVTVELAHRHHHQGKLFDVRLDMTVPGDELVVSRQRHEDAYVAVRDAFDTARRLLEDYERVRRGDVKQHEAPAAEA